MSDLLVPVLTLSHDAGPDSYQNFQGEVAPWEGFATAA